GRTIRLDGVEPKLHLSVAPIFTSFATVAHLRYGRRDVLAAPNSVGTHGPGWSDILRSGLEKIDRMIAGGSSCRASGASSKRNCSPWRRPATAVATASAPNGQRSPTPGSSCPRRCPRGTPETRPSDARGEDDVIGVVGRLPAHQPGGPTKSGRIWRGPEAAA